MANQYGMLGLGAADALDAQANEARRARAMDYARLTPAQQSSFNASNTSQMVGEGMGGLIGHGIGALTGTDTRSTPDKMRAVQQQMTQALQGVNPEDIDKAYPIMIRILQQNGMTPEAMAMAQEYEKLKNTKRTADRLETKEANDVRLRQLKLDQHDPRSPLQKSIKGLEDLMAKRDAMPEGSQQRANADVAIETMIGNISKETKGSVVTVDAGDYMEIINKEDGTLIRRIAKGNDPNKKGGDLDPVTGKAKKDASDTTLRELPLALNDVAELARLSQSFHPSYVLPPGLQRLAAKIATGAGFEDKVQIIQNLFGANQAAAAWWSAYASLMINVRHAKFGATLTANEKASFNLIQALMVKSPDDTINKLKEQATAAFTATDKETKSVGSVKNIGEELPAQLEATRPLVERMRGSSVAQTYTAPTAPVPQAAGGVTEFVRGPDGSIQIKR